jgi:hypothetical protein
MPYEEWVRDMTRVVDDKLMRDIVNDNRVPQRPTLPTVKVEGAGPVTTPTVSQRGWVDPAPLQNPPGIAIIDAMCQQQDMLDKLELAKKLGALYAQMFKAKSEEQK